MKDLYWKTLAHVHGSDHWGHSISERAENIYQAEMKVKQMDPLELLQAISGAFEKDANE